MPFFSFSSKRSRSFSTPNLLAYSVNPSALIFSLKRPFLQSVSPQVQHAGIFFSIQHFLFTHHSASLHQERSLNPSNLQPLHSTFSEQRQHARPHLAIPNSRFIDFPFCLIHHAIQLYAILRKFFFPAATFPHACLYIG